MILLENMKKGIFRLDTEGEFPFVLPVGWGYCDYGKMGGGDYMLGVVFSGEVEWQLGEEKITQRSGEILFCPWKTVSGAELLSPEGQWAYIVLRGGREMAKELLGETSFLLRGDGDGAVTKAVAHLCYRLSAGGERNPCQDSARAYKVLMDLLYLCRETRKPLSEPVREAVELMEREFVYIGGVEDLADRLEINKSHLIRSFTKQMGMSPGQYLQKVRIDYAKLLLSYKNYDLETIADLLGYSGANYFCKVFRKHMGVTPGEYRRRNRPSGLEREPQKLLDWEKLHF